MFWVVVWPLVWVRVVDCEGVGFAVDCTGEIGLRTAGAVVKVAGLVVPPRIWLSSETVSWFSELLRLAI